MTNTRSNPNQAPGDARYVNGFALPDMSAFLTAPPGFALGQRMACEAARFWAKRMHAYADQLETLARCDDPDTLIQTQMDFLKRARDDYIAEGEVVKHFVTATMASTSEHTAQDKP